MRFDRLGHVLRVPTRLAAAVEMGTLSRKARGRSQGGRYLWLRRRGRWS
jgi:hypothetical protein